MSPNSPLTSHKSLASPSSPGDRLRPHLPVPSPASFRLPLGNTLFTNLLFNREQVYADRAARSHKQLAESILRKRHATGPSQEGKTSERSVENMSPTSYLKDQESVAKVSKRGGRPKKSRTKSKGKPEEAKSRKRAASRGGDGRPAKTSRTTSMANMGRKIGSSAALTVSKTAPKEIIIIPDDDDEEEVKPEAKPIVPFRTSRSTKAESPLSEDDLTPSTVKHNITQKDESSQQLHSVRQELAAAKATIDRLQQEATKARTDQTVSEADLANFKKEVEAERQAARTVMQECDQLRGQLQEAVEKKESQTQELQELRNLYDREIQSRKEEGKSHAEMLDNILNSNTRTESKVKTLETDNARLVHELGTLKAAAATFRSGQTLSPVPSTISSVSDEDRKEDNVRKMYITTKRKYDILASVATNLVKCTRSMDLTSFGDFGTYIKKLRNCLEGENSQSNRQAMVLRKSDDDDEDDRSESQRSHG